MIRIAVIGLGRRLREMCKQLAQVDAEVRISAVVETDLAEARRKIAATEAPADDFCYYASIHQLVECADQYDALMIGTRCHLHTPLAVAVAKTGLPLFLEKPVAITHEQLADLAAAYGDNEERVFVSFPLRFTPLFRKALEIVRSGRLGTINQVQAWNNVPYGGVYFGEWYRNYDQSGGLFLQKATHDFDYINKLVGKGVAAQRIAATTSRTIFGGEMPFDLMCDKCDRTDACMESPKNLRARGDEGGAAHHHPDDKNHWCLFSDGIRNEDAGSALITYENGVHASYSQNFATRRSAGKRGATVTGYTGTLEFDWYTETVRFIDHHTPHVDEHKICAATGHMGGDHRMLKCFVDLIRGEAPSMSSLKDAIASAAMCLAARESARKHSFEAVTYPMVKCAMSL
jgi:predicted dehydrogenase